MPEACPLPSCVLSSWQAELLLHLPRCETHLLQLTRCLCASAEPQGSCARSQGEMVTPPLLIRLKNSWENGCLNGRKVQGRL